jgi:hypothetical protein
MAKPTIERVDEIPLLIYWLQKMQVDVIIDRVLPLPHGNRQGLSYGQLALLFVVYVIYLRNHRLCGMEEWVEQHHGLLQRVTGWPIKVKDATDVGWGTCCKSWAKMKAGERACNRPWGVT